MKSFGKPAILLIGIVITLIVWSIIRDSSLKAPSTNTVVKEKNLIDKQYVLDKLANTKLVNEEVSRSLRFYQDKKKLVNDPMDRSELSEMALILDDPNIDEGTAMNAVYDLLSSLSVTTYRGKFPAGLNVEITNALLGKNIKKVGVLPMDSPRINENGELVDMNNEPYWVHTSPSGNLKIHSAGADRAMHTADDVIFPTP